MPYAVPRFDVSPAQTALLPLGALAGYALWQAWRLYRLTDPVFQREILHECSPAYYGQYVKKAEPYVHVDEPEKHGMAPFEARNVYIPAKDGSKIHGWHVLPHSVYRREMANRPTKRFAEEVYDRALAERPTILFLHGTGWTVAGPHRVAAYQGISSRLDCNVIAIDYRGYGLSTGLPQPNETACFEDARSSYDWFANVYARVAPGKQAHEALGVVGHSMGGSIGADLVLGLQNEGIKMRCFAVNGSPINMVQMFSDCIDPQIHQRIQQTKAIGLHGKLISTMRDTFDLGSRLKKITCPILLTYSTGEAVVNRTHYEGLYDILFTGRTDVSAITLETGEVITRAGTERAGKPEEQAQGERNRVVAWLGNAGSHSDFVGHPGIVDLFGEIMGL